MKSRLNPIISLLLLWAVAWSQDLKIVHMAGTFDLDGDGLQEFATVEEGIEGDHKISVVRYYELDADGYQRMTWELKAPDGLLGNFVDVMLGDLDGDGTPELITVSNMAKSAQEEVLQPVVFYFYWDGERFSEDAGAVLNLAGGRRFLRCHNFVLTNIDGDMDQELVVSLGSPLREFTVLDLDQEGNWVVRQHLRPKGMRSGIGFIYITAVDWDRDGFDDLVGFSPEGDLLRTQAFYNLEGTLKAGEAMETPLPGLDGVLPRAIADADWDQDGFRDILLPFRNGDVIALTLSDESMAIEKLPVESGPLSDMKIADFNQDDFEDILLVSGEMNIITLSRGNENGLVEPADYFSLEEEGAATQVFATLPVVVQGVYTGSVIAAGWDGNEAVLFITDLGQGPKPAQPALAQEYEPEREDVLEIIPEIEEPLELPRIPKPVITMGQPLPKGILPRHVLTVNQAFAYTLPEGENREFYSFRWLQPPPKGMFFHYDSRSIRWVPDDAQLGAFKLAYHVEWKVGEDVEPVKSETDTLVTYKVIPQLEGEDERLWIYVNDPPIIVSEPEGVEFVAGTEFVYRPLVLDRNPDKALRFSLEEYPDGMIQADDGTISWQTDSTHVDVYDVRLVVSDGFDRAAQNFRLFARAGVKILSEAPMEAEVDEPYKYKVEVWRPNLEQILSYNLVGAPEGMIISEDGLVEWTPSSAQIDSQSFKVVVRHGVATDSQRVNLFVNHPPVIEEAPLPMNVVKLGEEYRFQIGIYDPNKDDELVFTALEMPVGMRMDPFTALIVWEPTRENIDFSKLVIDVTDGRDTRRIEADFFVNAPINIVSIPPMQATVDEPYHYQVMTADMNRGTLLTLNTVLPLYPADNFRVYSVEVSDDVYVENIDRYIMDWENAPAVYLTEKGVTDTLEVSRLNLKKYVRSVFWEKDRLYLVLESIDDRTVAIKDVLWEFFQGAKGKPPRVVVRKIGTIRYTLTEFPDGMEVDEYTGVIKWTPTIDQVDKQQISLLVSDGYSKDEQTFQIYVNQPPVVVSKPPVSAMVGEVFKYQLQVEDKNTDADLVFSLLKAPQGMQMSKTGKIVWIPKESQINENEFSVQVSDGYREAAQSGKVFVNINPSIISTPRPVALTGHDYKYRVVAEDLNQDKIAYRAIKLPKYSSFNRKTGVFYWKPKPSQRGPNDVIIAAMDSRGATTAHEFQIHVFEDPSARRMINTGWPLLLTFVGVMFAWGVAQM
ncbi:MAG: putative Ig domain-containing protein [Fidelibacterota bacterium]